LARCPIDRFEQSL
jgi:hypothetical protein